MHLEDWTKQTHCVGFPHNGLVKLQVEIHSFEEYCFVVITFGSISKVGH